MDSGTLAVNGRVVADLRRMLHSGKLNLGAVPSLIKEIISREMWRERVEPATGEIVPPFRSFVEFITTPPMAGLGADLALLKRICAEDKVALDLIDRVTTNPNGRPITVDNVNTIEDRPGGNSEQYALRKLRKDAPTLHARVLAGEMTAHGAMIEAGFRRSTMTLPTDPDGLARALKRRLSASDLAALIAALTE
jgi:hypothetical protein